MSLNLLSFADDTTVLAFSSNIPILINQINSELAQMVMHQHIVAKCIQNKVPCI